MMKIQTVQLSRERTGELLKVIAGLREINFAEAPLADVRETLAELYALTETVKRVSDAIGADPDVFKKTLYRSILVARRDPEVTKKRFQDNAAALSFKPDVYRKMCIQDPAQLEYTPKKLAEAAKILREFNIRGILKNPVEDYMRTQPAMLGWQASNFELRLVLAEKTGLKDAEDCHIIHRRRWETEDLLVECFKHSSKDKVIGPDETDLLALYKQGLFKSYRPAEPSELVVGG